MDDTLPPSGARIRSLLFVALVGVSLIAYLALPQDSRAEAIGSELLVLMASAVSAVAILRWAGGWPGARAIAALWALVAVVELLFLIMDLVTDGSYGPRPTDALLLAFLVPVGFAMRDEYGVHFHRGDRRAVTLDVLVLSVSLAAIAYVLIRPVAADAVTLVSVAVASIVGA